MEHYENIESALQHHQSLLSSIVKLHSVSIPSRPLKTQALTHQQIMSQIYEHVKKPFEKLKGQIDEVWGQDLEAQSESVEQNVQQDENQQEMGQFGDQQNEEQQGNDQEEMQDENQLMQGDFEEQMRQQDEGQNLDKDGNLDEDGNPDQDGILDEDGPISDEDIGLYGEELDEQEMESYENEEMQDDPEFGNFKLGTYRAEQAQKEENEEEGDDQEQDFINDNFDQFREIEMQKDNQQNDGKDQIDIQIDRLEQKVMQKKDWTLTGEVKAKERPVNSLLDTNLNYKSGLKFSHQINQQYNQDLESMIKQRILDEVYDDRTRFVAMTNVGKSLTGEPISTQKSTQGLAELYEADFRNHLGLGQNKDDKLKKDILDSLKQLNYYLDSLSNVSFTFKPAVSLKKKNGADSIVAQEKVPVTQWDGDIDSNRRGKPILESEKEVDKKGKRLKNKRIARQRKKEQDKKKMNKLIEYGGMTKKEAEARKKIAKTKNNAIVKYNKSNKFFDRLNTKDSKPGKPNANLNKLKI